LGQIIKTESVLTDQFSEKYDLSYLPNGIYFVKMTIDEQSIVKRVSVQ
jgi:Secretion system C-terminal sorting domain